jgi:hypothetical protein
MFYFLVFLFFSNWKAKNLVHAQYSNANSNANSNVFIRVPKYSTNAHVTEFVYEHGIHDCFSNVKDENTLMLKCWKDNQLHDVTIQIKPHTKTKKKRSWIQTTFSI